MNKKHYFAAFLVASFTFASLSDVTPVQALDMSQTSSNKPTVVAVEPISYNDEIAPTSSDIDDTTPDVISPDSSNDPASSDQASKPTNETADEITDLEHNGTSGEPEVVCADENEPDCSPEDTADPELWPYILSLSALGVTFLVIIIINLFGRKK